MRRKPFLRSAAGFLFRDLWWKLLSLGIAVLLWLFAVSEPTMSTLVSVPVQFKGMPESLEISSDVVERVYLEVRGPASELLAMEQDPEYAVVLDMSQVRPGEQTFSIREGNVLLPRGTRLVRAIPSQLRFEFERRVWRDVPVHIRLGEPQKGYEIADYEVRPRTLRIVGPESRVGRIQSVTTDPVDIASVVGVSEFRVTAYVDDAHVRFVTPPQVVVKVQVRARPNAPPSGARK